MTNELSVTRSCLFDLYAISVLSFPQNWRILESIVWTVCASNELKTVTSSSNHDYSRGCTVANHDSSNVVNNRRLNLRMCSPAGVLSALMTIPWLPLCNLWMCNLKNFNNNLKNFKNNIWLECAHLILRSACVRCAWHEKNWRYCSSNVHPRDCTFSVFTALEIYLKMFIWFLCYW